MQEAYASSAQSTGEALQLGRVWDGRALGVCLLGTKDWRAQP